MKNIAAVPNPGSDEARKAGCTCPVLDNNHGHGAYLLNGKPVFWMTEDCPIHCPVEEKRTCRRKRSKQS